MVGEIKKLHFVYNEASSPLSLLVGFAHRVASPETYACHLCDITYGRFLMKEDWKRFVAELPFPTEFHFKDKFTRRFERVPSTAFPAAFVETSTGEFEVLISAYEMNDAANLQQLQDLVRAKLRH